MKWRREIHDYPETGTITDGTLVETESGELFIRFDGGWRALDIGPFIDVQGPLFVLDRVGVLDD